VARDTDLVAFRVSEVGAIVVGVVLGPQARSTLRCASARQCHGISLIDRLAAPCEESDHLTVADHVRFIVIGLSNEEERAWFRMRLPSGPGPFCLAEAFLDAEHWHERSVESESAIEVAYADKHVREHAGCLAHTAPCAA